MYNKALQNKSVLDKEALNALPIGFYDGKITTITEPEKVPEALHEISMHKVAGFDTETRPSFQKGERYNIALMQIAIPNKVFLIRLHQTGITKEMISFFENTKILKTGVGLQDDIKGLQRLYPFNPNGFVELSEIAKTVGLQEQSVKKLAGKVLGFRISKRAQTSNWELPQYTEGQIRYAATDAWVCLEVYHKLTKTYSIPSKNR